MTTDRHGNLHADNGQFTDKAHTAPGASATLSPVPGEEQITDVVPEIDFEDPRLADALGGNPYDLSETEQRMLRMLLKPDVANELADLWVDEDSEDPDEELAALYGSYDEIDTDELYTIDQIGSAVCANRGYAPVFDLLRGSDGSCDAYQVGLDVASAPRIARTHDLKYLDPRRGVGRATGLRKAVFVAAVIDDDIAQLQAEAKRHALDDIDLSRLPGLGARARRISETEAKARLHPTDTFWRVECTPEGPVRLDGLGSVRTSSIYYGELTLTGTGAKGGEEKVTTGGALFFATDHSGAVYVLDGTDQPVIGLLPT